MKIALRCLGLAALAGGIAWLRLPPFRGNLADFGDGVRITDRQGELVRVTLGRKERLCIPVPLAETGDWTVRALIATEDKRFFRHPGIDGIALLRAAAQNLFARRVVSGASTITTLVAKLADPRPRTLWTKLVEARHAFDIEKRLTKNQILEQYLNRAPFGGNLYGIEAASRFYFGKPARELTLSETALLIGVPQRPARLRPDRAPANAMARRDRVLARMQTRGFITANERAHAAAQPIAIDPHPMPFEAPHFSDFALKQYPGRKVLHTTLDPRRQALAETTLRRHLDDLRRTGVRGGAVVIIEVRTGAVRAMVGSPDFDDRTAAGQVNAAAARRSPGSALKPFIYALAIDQGLCTPETILQDSPVSFAGYRPRNATLDYSGPVSVRRALVRSLNIPAMAMTDTLGLSRVAGLLREAGITTLDKPDLHYGLSLAIGSGEVTLLELTNAYACLARGGLYRPWKVLQEQPAPATSRVFTGEAAWLIADMLSGDERAAEITGHIADVALPRVALKTGTSSGLRDAWALAWNPEYAVGVWLGNPNGMPSAALIGGTAAAPAAFEIFRGLYPEGRSPWFERPAGLATREVCAKTGLVPGPSCAERILDGYIPNISSTQRCPGHRTPRRGHDRVIPTSIASTTGPAPAEAIEPQERGLANRPVQIVAPENRETFRLLDDTPHPRQHLKLAARGEPGASLFWFVDGLYLARSDSTTPIFWPLQRGRHTFRCADDHGHNETVGIRVE